MVFQALAHGTFQGGLSGVQGGNFWTGFASASISSMVGSVWSGGKLANGSTWKGVGGSWGSGDFGTIAFGTVSGGAGAALTGGNFWQGAATGFTVTALNHAMHKSKVRATLREKLVAEGYDPDAVATMTEAAVVELAQKVIPELFEAAGKPQIEIKEKVMLNGEEVFAISSYKQAENTLTGNVSLHKVNPIKLSMKAFSSYMQLTSTLGHELVHVIDFKGDFFKWVNRYGIGYATARTEMNAHEWQINMGAPVNYQRYLDYHLELIGRGLN